MSRQGVQNAASIVVSDQIDSYPSVWNISKTRRTLRLWFYIATLSIPQIPLSDTELVAFCRSVVLFQSMLPAPCFHQHVWPDGGPALVTSSGSVPATGLLITSVIVGRVIRAHLDISDRATTRTEGPAEADQEELNKGRSVWTSMFHRRRRNLKWLLGNDLPSIFWKRYIK